MADRSLTLAGLALVAATLMPSAAKADVRIEERLSSLDSARARMGLRILMSLRALCFGSACTSLPPRGASLRCQVGGGAFRTSPRH